MMRERKLSNMKIYNDVYDNYTNNNVNNNVYNNVDNNMYDPDEDEDIRDFDYSDVNMDTDTNVYTKHNPLNPETQLIIHDCCYALMSGRVSDPAKFKELPCFEAMKGRCRLGTQCKFSHNDNILRKEYEAQLKDLNASPYGKNNNSNILKNNVNNSYAGQNNYAGQYVTPKNALNKNLFNMNYDNDIIDSRTRDSGGTYGLNPLTRNSGGTYALDPNNDY